MDVKLFALVAFVLALVVTTIWLGVREIQRWRDRTSIVSKQQLILRLFNCGLVLLLLGLFLWGMLFVTTESHGLKYQMIFWYNLLGLSFLVSIVALIDLYYVMRVRRHSRIWLESHLVSLSHLEATETKDTSA